MNPKKPRAKCLSCGKEVKKPYDVYCSSDCYNERKYKIYIAAWKNGEVTGAKIDHALSGHLRRYLREKYGEGCTQCGWGVRHSITGRVPLEVDHIDGNWLNNHEDNLRLLCPNCHSLTPTFRNLNKGKGRTNRRIK